MIQTYRVDYSKSVSKSYNQGHGSTRTHDIGNCNYSM